MLKRECVSRTNLNEMSGALMIVGEEFRTAIHETHIHGLFLRQ